MSKVYQVWCDQCGDVIKDKNKAVHISPKCNLAHIREPGSPAVINIEGAFSKQFQDADFCSPICAGNFLFGLSPTKAKPV